MGMAQSLSFLRGSWGPRQRTPAWVNGGALAILPPTGHEAILTAGDASELPFCSCDRPSGPLWETPGPPTTPACPGAEKQGQKAVPGSGPKPWGRLERPSARPLRGSPGWGTRGPPPGRCPRMVGAPAGPLGAQALSLPARGGRWAYSQSLGRGRRSSCARHPACVRGPGAPAAGRPPPSEVPLPPGPARIQETTPRAPSGPAALSRPDTALGVLRPGLGRAGGRRAGRPQGFAQ